MEFTIYSVGDGPLMEQIFIAMAMISGAGDYVRAIQIGMLIGIIASMFQSVISGDGGGASPWKSIFLGWLLYMLMFSWPATVKVEEMHSADVRVIANVPGGVAATGSMISTIGYKLSQLFETGYSTVLPGSSDIPVGNPLKILMGAMDAAQQSLFINVINDVHASGGDLLKSLNNYLMECTYVKMEMGLMTPEKFESDSAAGVLENMRFEHPLYVTELYLDGSSPVTYTCPDGHDRIRQLVNSIDLSASDAIKDAYKGKLSKLDGDEIDVLDDVFVELTTAAQTIAHSSNTAHQMVFTSIIQKVHERASAGYYTNAGDTGAAFALNQALQQRALQNAASQSMFERAMLPLMTIMEALFYAITPFLGFAFVVGTFGAAILKNYMKLMLWLQLWLPLHSIINLYTLTAVNGDMGGFIFNNFYALDTAEHHLAEYMGVAGMLTASIPMLAWALLTGGTSLAMLAGRIGGADHFDEKQLAPDIVKNAPMAQSSSVIGGNADQGWTREGHSVVGQEISLGSQLQQGAAYKRSLSATNSKATMESLSNAYENMTSNGNQERMAEAVESQVSTGTDAVSQAIREKARQISESNGWDASRTDQITGQIGLGLSFGKAALGGKHMHTDVEQATQALQKQFQSGDRFSESEKATFAKNTSRAASNSIDRTKTNQDAVKFLDTAQEQSSRAVADAEIAEKAESLSNNASVSQKGYANSFLPMLDSDERTAIDVMAQTSSAETKAHIASQQQFYEQAGYGADAKLAAQFVALAKGVGASDEDRFENVSALADMVGGKWQENDLSYRVDSAPKDLDLKEPEKKELENPSASLPDLDLRAVYDKHSEGIKENSGVRNDIEDLPESSARRAVESTEETVSGIGKGLFVFGTSLTKGEDLETSINNANTAAYPNLKRHDSTSYVESVKQQLTAGSVTNEVGTQPSSGKAPAVTWNEDSDLPRVMDATENDGFPSKDGVVIGDLPKSKDLGSSASLGGLTPDGRTDGKGDDKQSSGVTDFTHNPASIIGGDSSEEPGHLEQSVASEPMKTGNSGSSNGLPETKSSMIPSGDGGSPNVVGFSDDGVPILAGEKAEGSTSQPPSGSSENAISRLSQESEKAASTSAIAQSADHQVELGRLSAATSSSQPSGQQTVPAHPGEGNTGGGANVILQGPHSTGQSAAAELPVIAASSETAVAPAEGAPVVSGQAPGQQTVPTQRTEAGTSGGAAVLSQGQHLPGQSTVSGAPVVVNASEPSAASSVGDPVSSLQVSEQQTVPAQQAKASTGGGANVIPQGPHSQGQGEASKPAVMANASEPTAASPVGDLVTSPQASEQQKAPAQQAEASTGDGAVFPQGPRLQGQGEASSPAVMASTVASGGGQGPAKQPQVDTPVNGGSVLLQGNQQPEQSVASEPPTVVAASTVRVATQVGGQGPTSQPQVDTPVNDGAVLLQGNQQPEQGVMSEIPALAAASTASVATQAGVQGPTPQPQVDTPVNGGVVLPQSTQQPEQAVTSETPALAAASTASVATQAGVQGPTPQPQVDTPVNGGAVLPQSTQQPEQAVTSEIPVLAAASTASVATQAGVQGPTLQPQVDTPVNGGAVLPQSTQQPEQAVTSETSVLAAAPTPSVATQVGGQGPTSQPQTDAPLKGGAVLAQGTQQPEQSMTSETSAEPAASTNGGAVLSQGQHLPGQSTVSGAPVVVNASEPSAESSVGDLVASPQAFEQQTVPAQQAKASTGGGANVIPQGPHSTGQSVTAEPPVITASSDPAVAPAEGVPVASGQAPGQQTVPAQQTEAGTSGGAVFSQGQHLPGQSSSFETPIMATAVAAAASSVDDPVARPQASEQQTVPAQQAEASAGGGANVIPQGPHSTGQSVTAEPPVIAASSETAVAPAEGAPVASGQAPGQQTVPIQRTEAGTSGGAAVLSQGPHSSGQSTVSGAPVVVNASAPSAASSVGDLVASLQASEQQTVPAQQAKASTGGGANVIPQGPHSQGQGEASKPAVMANASEPAAASPLGDLIASSQVSEQQKAPAQQVEASTGDGALLSLGPHSLGKSMASEAPVVETATVAAVALAGDDSVISPQASGQQTVPALQSKAGTSGGAILPQGPRLQGQGEASSPVVMTSALVPGGGQGPAKQPQVDTPVNGWGVLPQDNQPPEQAVTSETPVLAAASAASVATQVGGQGPAQQPESDASLNDGAVLPQGNPQREQRVASETPAMAAASTPSVETQADGQGLAQLPQTDAPLNDGAILLQGNQEAEQSVESAPPLVAAASTASAATQAGVQGSAQQPERDAPLDDGAVLPQSNQQPEQSVASETPAEAEASTPSDATQAGGQGPAQQPESDAPLNDGAVLPQGIQQREQSLASEMPAEAAAPTPSVATQVGGQGPTPQSQTDAPLKGGAVLAQGNQQAEQSVANETPAEAVASTASTPSVETQAGGQGAARQPQTDASVNGGGVLPQDNQPPEQAVTIETPVLAAATAASVATQAGRQGPAQQPESDASLNDGAVLLQGNPQREQRVASETPAMAAASTPSVEAQADGQGLAQLPQTDAPLNDGAILLQGNQQAEQSVESAPPLVAAASTASAATQAGVQGSAQQPESDAPLDDGAVLPQSNQQPEQSVASETPAEAEASTPSDATQAGGQGPAQQPESDAPLNDGAVLPQGIQQREQSLESDPLAMAAASTASVAIQTGGQGPAQQLQTDAPLNGGGVLPQGNQQREQSVERDPPAVSVAPTASAVVQGGEQNAAQQTLTDTPVNGDAVLTKGTQQAEQSLPDEATLMSAELAMDDVVTKTDGQSLGQNAQLDENEIDTAFDGTEKSLIHESQPEVGMSGSASLIPQEQSVLENNPSTELTPRVAELSENEPHFNSKLLAEDKIVENYSPSHQEGHYSTSNDGISQQGGTDDLIYHIAQDVTHNPDAALGQPASQGQAAEYAFTEDTQYQQGIEQFGADMNPQVHSTPSAMIGLDESVNSSQYGGDGETVEGIESISKAATIQNDI